MSKRKKKGNRRRNATVKTFRLGHYGTTPLYQSRFQDSDMAWLADEYQRRSRFEPSLTLEDFASEYGVSADELRFHAPDLSRKVDHSVILWHGTTKHRAQHILEEGFRAKRGKRKRIYFAGRPSMARGIAQRKAGSEDSVPVVIRCSIDLNHYDDYERRGNAIYAFRHECIGSDVIEEVTGLPERYREETVEPEYSGGGSTDVALTFNSSRAGIAYWINSYLKLDESHKMTEDHEIVEKIKRWLDEQMDAGRFGEAPTDEVLEQMREYERSDYG